MQTPTSGPTMERPLHIFKVSGDSAKALRNLHESYTNLFQDHRDDPDFANAAFTANIIPDRHNIFRYFFLSRDFQEAANKMRSRDVQCRTVSEVLKPRKLCFLFPGYGCQYGGMARELYDTSPVFRKHFDHCCDIFETKHDIPLKSAIFDEENEKRVDCTLFGPAGIFTVEYSLLKLWESFGIKPDYVLGHSIGEAAAAVAAEFISFDDAINLIAENIKILTELPKGSMLIMLCDQHKAKQIMEENNLDLDIAAMNHSSETMIAGDYQTMKQLKDICDEMNINAILFDSIIAGHSRHMDPVLNDIRRLTDKMSYKPRHHKDVTFISSVTGNVVDESGLDSEYWTTQARQPVNFIGAVAQLSELGVTDFLEIGPGTGLSRCVFKNMGGPDINAFASIKLMVNDWEVMLDSLGQLYLLGYEIDWEGLDVPYNRKKVNYLPVTKPPK